MGRKGSETKHLPTRYLTTKLKMHNFSEPREIQKKLANGADFCTEINDLLLRCTSPLKSCLSQLGVAEVANALLHDVVPLNKPKLFRNINYNT